MILDSPAVAKLLEPIEPGQRNLSPSALGQFIRSEQCQRLFRFGMYPRDHRKQLAAASGIDLEPIPPTLTISGRDWELSVESSLQDAGWFVRKTDANDDRDYLRDIRLLEPDSSVILLQSNMSGDLGDWTVGRARPDLILAQRDEHGQLSLLIADLKSTRSVELEHRLQVAIYAMLARQHFPDAEITQAVLYRKPLEPESNWPEDVIQHREAARSILKLSNSACLAIATNPARYEDQIRRIVLAPNSIGDKVARAPFTSLPFHINGKCDTCAFNRFCIGTARDANDLSLIPYMTEQAKYQIESLGPKTVDDLAAIVDQPEVLERLRETPGLGSRIDDYASRAGQYLAYRSGEKPGTRIGNSGQSTLPSVSPDRHPSLIRIFIDLQVDSATGRVYLASALVGRYTNGANERQSTLISLSEKPVESAQDEADLIRDWLRDVIGAITSLTRGESGFVHAPIHLYLWNTTQLAILGDLTNRQADAVFGLDAIMALITQVAGFDSPNVSIIAEEVRHQRMLPILCQTLQTIAPWFRYVTFSPGVRKQFRYQLFDAVERDEAPDGPGTAFLPARARFRSEIPTEYARKAWGLSAMLPTNPEEDDDEDDPAWSWSLFGQPSLDDLKTFQTERLNAISRITDELRPNPYLHKSDFDLTPLRSIAARQSRPIDSIREFAALERHFEMSEWRGIRSSPMAARILQGETLPLTFHDADQDTEVVTKLNDAREKSDAFAATGKKRQDLEKDERKSLTWSVDGIPLRFRIDLTALPVSLTSVLQRNRLGSRIVLTRATSTFRPADSPEPIASAATARQILGGMRGGIAEIQSDGQIVVEIRHSGGASSAYHFAAHPFVPRDGGTYLVDEDPNSETGALQWEIIDAIRDGTVHAGYQWLIDQTPTSPICTVPSSNSQANFMAGLNEFGLRHTTAATWELSKQRYIGQDGGEPMVMVQGPPGTGKSTTTGMAIWARIQGAIAGGAPFRIAISCKTHNATDVLLRAVHDARVRLHDMSLIDPDLFDQFFDRRLFDVPLHRFRGRDTDRSLFPAPTGSTLADQVQSLRATEWVLCAATTHGQGRLARKAWLDGEPIWDLVVLDEASQMSVPEYLVATAGLKPDGRMIIVGDHRQMPPIVRQNDDGDATTTLDPFTAYRSIFDVVRNDTVNRPVQIKFAESFRIHNDVANFLRETVYEEDGIAFFSGKREVLTDQSGGTPLTEAILRADQPLLLVLHDEDRSQQRNQLEAEIALRLLAAFGAIDPRPSMGVVVPHRAQRNDVQTRVLAETGDQALAASIDTIERFQGNERDVIIYSATESDPAYLRTAGQFLFDPRRLTVAISRARQKLIVVAARSVFAYVPTDETALQNTAMWRALAETTCTVPIWNGVVLGHEVEVFANRKLPGD